MEKSKNSVEKNYIYNLIYHMLVVVIPLITTPYVSRVLNADGVGAFSYTTSIVSYFVLVGNLGVATYGQLKIAQFRNDRREMSKLFYELVLFRLILMTMIVGIYLIVIQFDNNQQYKCLYYVLIIQIVASSLDISWFLQGLEEFKKIVVRNTVIKLLSVLMILSFVKQPSDLLLYAFIMNGSTLLGNISIWVFVPRFLNKVKLKDLNIFQHLKQCLVYFIPTVATTIYLTLDKTMIGWFTETSFENGYYEQAHKIEQMAVTIVTSLSVVTMPRMAYLYKNNKIEKMKKRLEQTILFILMMAIPMCFGMASVSDYFVPLFLGSGFDKSATLLKIFSLLIIIVGLNNAVGKQVLMPIGRQNKYNIAVIAGALINFVLNFILIRYYTSIGAAIASVLAETTILLLFIYYSRDFISCYWILKNSIKFLIASIVMTITIRTTYSFLSMSWLSVTIQIGTGFLVYFIALGILRDSFFISGIEILNRKIAKKKN